MKIKICGMRDKNNIQEVAGLPVDFMGFIFYNKSPRYISTIDHDSILLLEKKKIKKVGVFVNENLNHLFRIAEKNKLDIIQCHGNENTEYCRHIVSKGYEVIKVFHISHTFDFLVTESYSDCCHYFLFDTSTKEYGGSGKKFNWNFLRNYKNSKPFFLSGGISPDDGEILKKIDLNIFAIDLNSQFETSPGIKNASLIGNFIHILRSGFSE